MSHRIGKVEPIECQHAVAAEQKPPVLHFPMHGYHQVSVQLAAPLRDAWHGVVKALQLHSIPLRERVESFYRRVVVFMVRARMVEHSVLQRAHHPAGYE